MRNKFFKGIIMSLTLSMATPNMVYATENAAQEMSDETMVKNSDEASAELSDPDMLTAEDIETDENGVISGIYYEDDMIPAGTPAEEALADMEGDGLDGEIVEVLNLPSSEENNCQVTLNADLPEGFDANIYVQLKNYDNGKIYQYTLYAVNNFTQRGYIPEGEYRIIECSVYDDINNSFPFNIVDDFTLKYGEVKSITVSLQDEAAAVDAIAERLRLEAEAGTKDLSEYTASDFDVTFTGTGSGNMAITGAQSQAMTIVAKVTKGGIPGDMTVDISLDDGMTFNLTNVEVPYSGMVKLTGTGLTLVFEVSKKSVLDEIEYGQFAEGDTFRSVIHDPTTGVNYGGEYKGMTKLQLVDENPDASIYEQMVYYNIPKVEIEVIKGGALGEAVIKYSLDGESYSDEMIVPESGTWQINGTTLSINFYATKGSVSFNTGDTYTAEPYQETKQGFIGILIAVGTIFAAGAIAVWYYFKKQIVSQGVYTIHEYTPVRTQPKANDNTGQKVSDKNKKAKKKGFFGKK